MSTVAATAVATIEPKPTPLSTDVRRMEKQFALALPEHVSPERFVRVVVTAIQANPDLQKADRESVLGAALKCAQDGLVPDGREAALVVYGGRAQYLPMIAGILTKVRRSGELKTIAAHVVCENDTFTYVLGDDEKIEHQPLLTGPRGKPIAVYAVAKTKDGGVYREVMSIEEVNQVRAVSRAKNGGPWVTWWGEMARKTVLRRMSKRLPMSTDLQQVFQRDDDHYDLNQARGAARLRRLHADFEEPDAPAQNGELIEGVAAGPDLDAVLDGDQIPETAQGNAREAPLAADGPTTQGAQPSATAPAASGQDEPKSADAPALDFPGDRPRPAAFDVIAWAGGLIRTLGGYSDVDVMRGDWNEHKEALQKASPGLFKELNRAVADRAAELAGK